MAHLLIDNGPHRGKSFPLNRESICLGRNGFLREQLSEDLSVSRRHAEITRERDGYVIQDLESRSGTLLNGRTLIDKQSLRNGDRIQLSGITLVFCQGNQGGEDHPLLDRLRKMTVIVDDETSSTLQRQVDVGRDVLTHSDTENVVKALFEMIGSLTSTENPDKILESLLGTLFQVFPKAQRGFVGTIGQGMRLDPAAVCFRNETEMSQVPVSRKLADLALSGRKAVLVRDAALDSKFDGSESVCANEIRSVMCVPLFDSDGQPLGIIQLDTPIPNQHFDEDDLQMLADLAPQAAFVLKFKKLHNRVIDIVKLEGDLKVAKSVQERLMPHRDPAVEGYEFFSFYRAARVLGGDFYSYIALPENRLAIVLADVEGKGIPAALYVARLAAELRRLFREEESLARIAERLNDSFAEDDEGRYLTLLLLALDSQSHTVSFVNAGHWDPVLRRANGKIESVGRDESGHPVGMFTEETYEMSHLELGPGDALIIFSDGFTDASDDGEQEFGHARVLKEIDNAPATASELGQHVVDSVLAHIGDGDQTDDLSLICIRRAAR